MSTSRTKPALVMVCTSSSRVAELERLRAWWTTESRVWIAPDSEAVRSLLSGEDWRPLPSGTGGRLALLYRCIGDPRQLVVADTGAAGAAAVAVARTRRVPSMVLESAAEPSGSFTRRATRRLADRVIVRWPDEDATSKFVHIGAIS